MNTTIIQAINNQEAITITYKGEERTVVPFAYGCDKLETNKLRAFQLNEDATQSGWRLFIENDISSVGPATAVQPAITGYKRDDKNLKVIYAQR